MTIRPVILLVVLLLTSCFAVAAIAAGALAIEGDAMPRPLAELQINPVDGERVFVSRDAGHCVLCHRVAGLSAGFQGDLGPDLSTVGARLTPAQLRLRIVDASLLNPRTIMPPYYRTDNLYQVAINYRNKPVLTAEQVEQLVAYLASLKR